MLKRWCGIKEIEVFLLCERPNKKNLLQASLNLNHSVVKSGLLVTATTFAQKAILGFNNVNELHP